MNSTFRLKSAIHFEGNGTDFCVLCVRVVIMNSSKASVSQRVKFGSYSVWDWPVVNWKPASAELLALMPYTPEFSWPSTIIIQLPVNITYVYVYIPYFFEYKMHILNIFFFPIEKLKWALNLRKVRLYNFPPKLTFKNWMHLKFKGELYPE
jgi:hypothetical protein